MKKQLLSVLAVMTVGAMMAQTPSPSVTINQNAVYPTPASVTNAGVKFLDVVDANVVWTVGQDLAQPQRNYNWYSKTTNGGTAFNGGNIFSDTNTYVIANMEGIDANTAWVASFMKSTQSQGAIHRTTNGGTNWVNMTAAGMYTNAAAFTNIVSFFTPSIGITMGDPVNGEFEIWRTTDGGLSWNQIPGANIDNPNSGGEFGIVNLYYRLGSNNLWFGTNNGRMYRTVDAGLTWSASVVGASTSTLIEIAFSSPNNGICTLINGNNWELWSTTDGGATWTQIPTIDPDFGFADLGSVPGTGMLLSVGIGGGNEVISSSIDNGQTWTDWGSVGIPYSTVDFASNSAGWFGSLNFQTFTNIWKYSGAAITGTTAPTVAFTMPANICLSGPTAVVSPINTSTGSPAPTYSWVVNPSGATLSSPTATNPTITFASANTYTVILIATNSAGTNSVSQVVTVAACVAPTASFALPAAACTNFTFTCVNGSSGAPNPSAYWTISPTGGTTISPSPIATSPVIKVTSAGVYTLTLLSTNASGTATSVQTINIGACPPNLSFTVPATIRYCDTQTFVTQNGSSNPPGVSGTINYTWSIAPTASIAPNAFQQNAIFTLTNTTAQQYTVTLRGRNLSGTTTVTRIVDVDDCTSGIEENSLAQLIGLYPNPVREQLNIKLPVSSEPYTIKVTNVLGTVVYQETVSKEQVAINLSNVARGVYFVTVENKNDKATRKVILD